MKDVLGQGHFLEIREKVALDNRGCGKNATRTIQNDLLYFIGMCLAIDDICTLKRIECVHSICKELFLESFDHWDSLISWTKWKAGQAKRTRPIFHECLYTLKRLHGVRFGRLQVRLKHDQVEIPSQILQSYRSPNQWAAAHKRRVSLTEPLCICFRFCVSSVACSACARDSSMASLRLYITAH